MTTTELNAYLRSNVKCDTSEFLNGSIEDRYSSFRNDASIYCWSGMNSVTNQVATNDDYCTWMQGCAKQIAQTESQFEGEKNILPRAIHCVKSDGDDLCDEQSVGWYLAVFTYMYCLAFNRYDYEEIFLKKWKLYFTEAFQQNLRSV